MSDERKEWDHSVYYIPTLYSIYLLSINSLKGHSVAPLALSGFLKIEGGEIDDNLGYFDKINVHRNFY